MSTNTFASFDQGNLSLDVLDRHTKDPGKVALKKFNGHEWQDMTLGDFHGHVTSAAKGLIAHGVRPGSPVAILAKTRYEWTVLDYAVWWLGAISVPIYETSSASQISWILRDSATTHLFYESDEHRERVDTIRPDAPLLTEVLPISTVLTDLAHIGESVSDETLEGFRSALSSETIATIIYTSGTTGDPKGCQLTHGNFRAELDGAHQMLGELFDRDDASTLLFLPLAHVFARIIQVGAIRWGAILSHAPDIRELTDRLDQVKPTFLLAVGLGTFFP